MSDKLAIDQHLNLTWSENDMVTVLPILITLLSFHIYWFVAQSGRIKTAYHEKYKFDKASTRHTFFTKFYGLIILGVLPAIVCMTLMPQFDLAYYGLTINPETNLFSITWIVGLGLLLMVLAYFSADTKKNLDRYPQNRASVWTRKTILLYALGWALYMLGYEFLFRGVLLVPLYHTLGLWPAIAINVAMYSATHLPKGLKETIGAIPLGVVLCLLTLSAGTIWIAYCVHVIMVWTNNFRALYLHTELNYKSGL